jgi:Tol biopolymer transport system component
MNRLAAPVPVVMAIALSFALIAPAAQATFPGKNGKIAFGSAPAGTEDFDTNVMSPEGGGRTTIAQPDGPIWSPSGTALGLLPQQHGCCFYTTSIYTARADGSDLRALTDSSWDPDNLSWSADGSKLLFHARVCRRCDRWVYAMSSDGGALTPLRQGTSPSWDPTASRITYTGPDGVHVMAADGTTDHFLTAGDQPRWSPDGTRIAFVRGPGLYTIRPDGSAEGLLASGGAYVTAPAWSPSGDRLLFIRSDVVGFHQTWNLFAIGADGSGLTRLSGPGTGESVESAAWSPDGTQIVFADGPPRAEDLFVVNADGVALRNLTGTPSLWETDVDWQAIPGPRRGDFMNAAQFCKAEQVFWGDQFSQRYRNFGQCVSQHR